MYYPDYLGSYLEATDNTGYAYNDGTGTKYEGDSPPELADMQAWSPAPPDPIAKGIELYQKAYQAAEQNIFRLMVIVSGAMIQSGLFTQENVNVEGGEFVSFHQAPINGYKLSGRGPAKALALYQAIASEESKARFPWLDQPIGPGRTILSLFAEGLEVTP